MGDFNIDLLQYDTNTFSNDFINLLTSHSILPNILQPARVTDHSAIIIDNIFFNNTDDKTLSGNITALISDHFIQFLFLKNPESQINPLAILLMIILNLARKNLFMISQTLTGLY